MDKQALIDKLVDELKGIWPAHWVTAVYDVKSGLFSSWPPRREADLLVHICTAEEFKLRAKELGWISGYKWGVEYPTNGKKPDLPDDVDVDINFANLGNDWHGPSKVGHWKWDARQILRLRIVDERYKPKEPDRQTKNTKDLSDVIFAVSDAISVAVDAGAMPAARELQKINWDLLAKNHGVGIGRPELQAKLDNSWHERGELPPVGVECEYSIAGLPRKTCTFVGINSRGSMVIEDCHGQYKSYHAHQIKLHPIKTQREKFVEAALTAAYKFKPECDITFAQALYEAGFKAPDEKNRS